MPTKDEINQFSMTIEILAVEKNTTYMDAIILHCGIIGLEIELAAKLLSSNLKKKIEYEAQELNYLPKTHINKLV